MTTKTRNDDVYWLVKPNQDGALLPLLPLPRLIAVLDLLRSDLNEGNMASTVHHTAMELGEGAHVVGRIAAALQERTLQTQKKKLPMAGVVDQADPEEEARTVTYEPVVQSVLADWATLSDARTRLISSLDDFATTLCRKPKLRDLVVVRREHYRAEQRFYHEANDVPTMVFLWSKDGLYAEIDTFITEEVSREALWKRVERSTDVIEAARGVMAAYETYFRAMGAVQRVLQGDVGEDDGPPTF